MRAEEERKGVKGSGKRDHGPKMKMKGIKFPIVHSIADAVSLFLVTSLASSSVTGRIETLNTPIMTKMANKGPVLLSRTEGSVSD